MVIDLLGCRSQAKLSPRGKHLIIYRQDGAALYNAEAGLELFIPQEHQGSWTEAIEALSSTVNGFQSPKAARKPPPPPPKQGETFLVIATRAIFVKYHSLDHSVDPNRISMHANVGKLSQMVKSYMHIVHTTIQDLTPKFIILQLVEAVSSSIN